MVKILIVEDNQKNLKLFSILIKSQGFEVITAENGKIGIERAVSNLPDLILMDIQMPIMDGIVALKELKSIPEVKDIPVIALTSYAMKGDREKFLGEGFTSYISKPIRKNSFFQAIKEILNFPIPE